MRAVHLAKGVQRWEGFWSPHFVHATEVPHPRTPKSPRGPKKCTLWPNKARPILVVLFVPSLFPFFASRWLKHAVFAFQKAKNVGRKRGLRHCCRFRSGLKISSENEIFERATHRGPIFCGEIETSRLKFSSLEIKNFESEIRNFDRDQIFLIVGPSGVLVGVGKCRPEVGCSGGCSGRCSGGCSGPICSAKKRRTSTLPSTLQAPSRGPSQAPSRALHLGPALPQAPPRALLGVRGCGTSVAGQATRNSRARKP